MKIYTLSKAYGIALTFEAKNVEFAIENKNSFDVSCRDHNNGGKLENWKGPKRFFMFGNTK